MMAAAHFSGRKVALFGLGGSGMASAQALKAGGAQVYVWDDQPQAQAKARAAGLDVHDLRALDWSGLAALVLSPGVPFTHPEPHWSVKLAQAAQVEVIGDIELFCRERAALAPQALFVGITGTNGKSTTTALVAHVLAKAGFDVQLGGNIGTPALALAPPQSGGKRVHVLELSSYQIDLAPSLAPSIGVLINLSPDHLDRHGSMAHYASVKERLVRAADTAIIGTDDAHGEAIFLALGHAGKPVVPVSAENRHAGGLHFRAGAVLGADGAVLANLDGITALRGAHNAQNAAMALAVCRLLGVAEAQIQAGFASFAGLAHRLEQVGRVGKTVLINDSKATNADSTQKALAAFEHGIFWIVGGKPKAGGIEPLRPYFPRIAKAYLIGEAGEAFAQTLAGAAPYEMCGTLEKALEKAVPDAKTSEFSQPVILLSPSCASFDQYPNFEARGDAFRNLARLLPGFVP